MTDPDSGLGPPTRRSREGGWARAADAAAVASLALGLFVLLFGGFVLQLGAVSLRVSGAARLLFIAAALIAVRHAAHPAVPLHRRILQGLRERGTASAASIARASLLSRVTVLLIGYLAVVTIGLAQPS